LLDSLLQEMENKEILSNGHAETNIKSDAKANESRENKNKTNNSIKESQSNIETEISECLTRLSVDINGNHEQTVVIEEQLKNEKPLEGNHPSEGLINQSGCFLCGITTEHVCPDCGVDACPLHIQFHQARGSQHSTLGLSTKCLPFRVIWKEGVGRCVIATKDIQPLQLILQDKPVVLGPNYETQAVCVQCLGSVNGEYPCEKCNLLFCTEQCRQVYNDQISVTDSKLAVKTPAGHEAECSVLQGLERPLNVTQCTPGSVAYEYGFITVARLLALRDCDPEAWNRLQYLMDHREDRMKEEQYWRMFQVNVVDFMRKRCGLKDKYTDEEIHWAIGVARVNAANVDRPHMSAQGTSGKAIYPTFSYLSHSCMSNARYNIHPDDSMDLIAQVPIRKGDEITIQYISFLFGNYRRRRDIKNCWMFECGCKRCQDPTELNTYLSALSCRKCEGTVLPKSSVLNEPVWMCIECGEEVTSNYVDEIFTQLESEMYEIYEVDVEKYEATLEKYKKHLHKNHFQMLLLERNLAAALKTAKTVEQMERRVQLNQHFYDVFSVVDPGYSKWKGGILYEMCRGKLLLADIKYSKKEIDHNEFTGVIKNCIEDLNDVLAILEYSAQGTKDYNTRRHAEMSLKQAKEILHFATFMPL